MSSIYFTPITFASPLNSSVVNSPLGQLDQAIDDVLAGNLSFRRLNFGSPVTRTIASDAIARTRSYHTLIPQSGTSDDLKTITGGSRGDELKLEINDASYTITIKHGTGNIVLSSGQDLILNSVNQTLSLWFNGTNWVDSGGSLGIAPTSFQVVPYTVLSAPDNDIRIPASGSFDTSFSELEILLQLRSDRVAISDDCNIRINGDSGVNNYAYNMMLLVASAMDVWQDSNNGSIYVSGVMGDTATANRFSIVRLNIPGYARTNFHKHGQVHSDFIPASTITDYTQRWGSWIWKDTSAITHLNILSSAGSWMAGSAYAVWGKR